MSNKSLPLVSLTNASQWAAFVLQDPLALLHDHAHLEAKAASNALDLMSRWPERQSAIHWIQALSSVVRDETQHFLQVVKILEKRGGKLNYAHKTPYVQDLRKLVRLGESRNEVVDRLLVSSLIELRSCERFLILSQHCTDSTLKKLYTALWASEHGHYKIFLKIAEQIEKVPKIESRWNFLLKKESEIIKNQQASCRIHSWVE